MRDCFFIQMIRFSKGKSTSPAIILLGLFSISNNRMFQAEQQLQPYPHELCLNRQAQPRLHQLWSASEASTQHSSKASTSARALASNSAKFVYASEVELCRFHSHCTTYSSFTGRFLLLSSFSLIPLFMFLSCSSSFSFYPSSSSTSSSSSSCVAASNCPPCPFEYLPHLLRRNVKHRKGSGIGYLPSHDTISWKLTSPNQLGFRQITASDRAQLWSCVVIMCHTETLS